MISNEDKRQLVLKILGREPATDEWVDLYGAAEPAEVREICYGIARSERKPDYHKGNTERSENTMTGKERREMATELLGREPTDDEVNKVLGVSTPEDVRAVCADLLRNPGYYPDSYAGKAKLKATFAEAMFNTPNVDVTLIREAFEGALTEYMEYIEAD